MLYAREVMELMGAYPGRDFRMSEIVNYVRNGKNLTLKSRHAMHRSIFRVLVELERTQTVDIERAANGSYSIYRWREVKP